MEKKDAENPDAQGLGRNSRFAPKVTAKDSEDNCRHLTFNLIPHPTNTNQKTTNNNQNNNQKTINNQKTNNYI